MRIFLWLVAFFVLGCGGGRDLSKVDQVTNVGNSEQITVFINNQSTMPADRLHNYVHAQNIQLQQHFRPVWNVNAICQIGQAPAGIRTVTFVNGFAGHSVPGSFVGYHNNLRQGFVDFGTSNATWYPEVVASHEVLELLMNEYTDPGGYEICDPVHSAFYFIRSADGSNVPMSDFVFQNYYTIGSPGPWDYMNVITRAFTPMPGSVNFARGHSEAAKRGKRNVSNRSKRN